MHHWLKWYKFGFTRLFDNLSLEIRNSRDDRDERSRYLRQTGDDTPLSDIEKFCGFLRAPKIGSSGVREFRNPAVWQLGPEAYGKSAIPDRRLEVDGFSGKPAFSEVARSKRLAMQFEKKHPPRAYEVGFDKKGTIAIVARCTLAGRADHVRHRRWQGVRRHAKEVGVLRHAVAESPPGRFDCGPCS